MRVQTLSLEKLLEGINSGGGRLKIKSGHVWLKNDGEPGFKGLLILLLWKGQCVEAGVSGTLLALEP